MIPIMPKDIIHLQDDPEERPQFEKPPSRTESALQKVRDPFESRAGQQLTFPMWREASLI
jgi:hypothetical protein